MTEDLFRAMQVETFDPKPTPLCIFLVVAWHNSDKRWSVRRETSFHEFTTVEAAREYAAKQSAHWSHIRIYELRDAEPRRAASEAS